MTPFEVNTENGVWLCDKDAHTFDVILADALAQFFLSEKAESIVDVGCGSGDYVMHLRKAGLDVWGVDGNPKTSEFCERTFTEDILQAQPAVSMPEGSAPDWVLCLEVGEHIPPQHESTFLNYITHSCKYGIVLSWFPEEGHGIGHFNPRSNQYVKDRMAERGFVWDGEAESKLRSAVTLWWFTKSLMVYRRKQ